MDNQTHLQDVNVTDVPQPVLDAIALQAERRGWSRLKTIRHILAQAAAAEVRWQASKKTDSPEPV